MMDTGNRMQETLLNFLIFFLRSHTRNNTKLTSRFMIFFIEAGEGTPYSDEKYCHID